MTTQVLEGDLCGCYAITKPICEVLSRRPGNKRYWSVHAAPGDSALASVPSATPLEANSVAPSKRPLELLLERNLFSAPTADSRYRKVLPFLATGGLPKPRRKDDGNDFVSALVTLGTECTRERTSSKLSTATGGSCPSGVPRLPLRRIAEKEETQKFLTHSGRRPSNPGHVSIFAPEQHPPCTSSISNCWNLASRGLKRLQHSPGRQQRARTHTQEHQESLLLQQPVLISSEFHAGGTPAYMSPEHFHVGMPSLLEESKNIELLSPALQNAVTYLAVTKFPKERKLKTKFLLPPQAPQYANRVTLVLDMDETLMHCSVQPLETPPDFLVHFADTNLLGRVYVRPYAKLFLDLASQICEIVVFTASTQAYADQVLAQLDPENRFVQHRLYRQHCTVINGGHVKDLRLLGRDARRVVLADNSPISMALQPDNGIIVSTWTTDYDDRELMDLLMLLQHIATLSDVQEFLRSRYEFRNWINRVRPPTDPL